MLCDFLSMYPTVSTLMRLWRFVIARGMRWRDSTEETRAFLESTTHETLRDREVWKSLTTLVQIEPDGDVLPVRAEYPGSASATIGANHLTAPPLWYTLADCLASKILTGREPKVLQALTFEPDEPQSGLRPVAINGDARLRVNPARGDFYEELITKRQSTKIERDQATGAERDRFDAAQNSLKIAANATCYGIFAEIIVDEPTRMRQTVIVYTGTGSSFQKVVHSVDRPGAYFHPLLATLTTGAARLMLAITERLVTDAGLGWAFCDTDSMAIARPPDMSEETFYERVDSVVNWFTALNPYRFPGSVLQVEKVNQRLDGSGEREALHVFAISAKRYALFNVGPDGRPILRKASAHGLGHLRAPYDEKDPASGIPAPQVKQKDIGVARWQHDLWWVIANEALRGPIGVLPLDYHPALQSPAVSRYAATTPAIHGWFKDHNRNQPYDRQVRPFGFLNAFTALDGRPIVAPFDREVARSAENAFDRNTRAKVEIESLSTYAHALAGYHLSAEAKFENGRPFDCGETVRRHIRANGFVHIGKEANRWEEQFYLGLDPEADIVYDDAPDGLAPLIDELRLAQARVGTRKLAEGIGISRTVLHRWLTEGQPQIGQAMFKGIVAFLPRFWAEQRSADAQEDQARRRLVQAITDEGLTLLARRIGCDPANLAAMARGRRSLSRAVMLAALRHANDDRRAA